MHSETKSKSHTSTSNQRALSFAVAALEARRLRAIFLKILKMLMANLDFYSKPNYESSEEVEKKICSDRQISKIAKSPLSQEAPRGSKEECISQERGRHGLQTIHHFREGKGISWREIPE